MNYPPKTKGLKFLLISFILTSIFLTFTFCSEDQITSVPDDTRQDITLNKSNPEVQRVMGIQDRSTEMIMKNPDVVGTATGLTENGKLAILVLTKKELTFKNLSKSANPVPERIDNVPVRLYYSGEIKAMGEKKLVPAKKPDKPGKPGDGGDGGDDPEIDHRAKQDTPIKMGTSGGWGYDRANGYCCGGTLGALIQFGGSKYILSNYHVFEADIADGGNGIIAKNGDPIIQPGLIDVGCNANNAQEVATLVVSKSLPGSNVDASVAKVIPGMVDETGAILAIGTISSQTVSASVRQKVKKSGRTTGFTTSTVDGLNATVSITYENECAGGTAFTKTFTGQIIIKNRGSRFLAGGDSGSLMVEDTNNNPRAVGLLFAGSSTLAVANPIDDVLQFFHATMVGN
jgi:hypothetical protein